MSLPGHGAGHMGLWLPKVGDGVLYAADAAWTHQELSGQRTAWLSKLVSHDVAEALSISDHVFIIAEGKVIGQGAPGHLK